MGKTGRYFELAYNVQTDPAYKLNLKCRSEIIKHPCPNRLGNVNNMLIQNRIADIGLSEKIDLARQLRHFLDNLGSYSAT